MLVIIDASDPQYPRHTQVTRALLNELGAGERPVLYVFNKCDLAAVSDVPPALDGIDAADTVYISARTGDGIDRLAARLEELALDGKRTVTLRIPNDKQGVLNTVYAVATVQSVDYGAEYVTVSAIADERARGMLRDYLV